MISAAHRGKKLKLNIVTGLEAPLLDRFGQVEFVNNGAGIKNPLACATKVEREVLSQLYVTVASELRCQYPIFWVHAFGDSSRYFNVVFGKLTDIGVGLVCSNAL
ncbi:unnamed protein product [Echinostoma caproni]|uniref:Protein kinase domain-containing protein n=1 Tax=Echinostoma caproni TaxID=27848 RepID=A0A183AD11_9TREM|nr:unnamed protein product [Echinostoma caproni]